MNDAEYRLPSSVMPNRYRLVLAPDLASWTFQGHETVEVQVARPVLQIVLHAVDLEVTAASVQVGRHRWPARVSYQPGRETLTLHLPQGVPVGRATLELAFRGTIGTSLRGLYRVETAGRRYAFTQFEATDARRCFPCFDEPAFKARFQLAVTVPEGLTAISNSRVQRETPGPTPGTRTVHFAPTPRMSTYLVALAVGELESTAAVEARGTPIRVWTVPGKAHLGQFALEAAAASLSRLERYFGVKYPYGKLDLLAVPDFEAGAMENSGAIFFRETALLCDPATAPLAAKKRIALVVAHEIAHQWFGNLVTMQWWDDLWLNEAFATWIEFRTVADWQPDWEVWVDFQQEKAAPFHTDALVSTRAIRAPVKSAAQASEMFDAITYEKGAAVLRMLEHFLGPNVFRAGVRQYIRAHREGNATANDLFGALEQVSGRRVRAIARDWIDQPGFPLVRATVTPGGTRPHVVLEQQRFFADPRRATSPEATAQQWRVPLVLRFADGPRLAEQRALLSAPRAELVLEARRPPKWLYANAGESGFFRVQHDAATLHALLSHLPTALDAAERVGLVSNEWALTRAGYNAIDAFLEFLRAFRHEAHHAVVEAIVDALAYIEAFLLEPAQRPAFARYVEELFADQLAELGWTPNPAESDNTRLRRAAVVRALGRIARQRAVVAEAERLLEVYWADDTAVDPNLVDVLVVLGAQQGSARRFAQYLERVRTARTPQDEMRHLLGLGAFEEPELVQRALELSLTSTVRTQDVGLLLARLLSNPAGKWAAWDFIRAHWDAVEQRLPPFMRRRLIAAAGSLGTAAARQQIAEFFTAHPVEAAERTLQQTLEGLDLLVAFRERAQPRLDAWLAQAV
jgi:puromycin-sensitive aminopeptidase